VWQRPALTRPRATCALPHPQAVLDLPGLSEHLASLCQSSSQLQPLLSLLLRSFTYRAAAEAQAAAVLADIATRVPLAGQAEGVAERLLTSAEALAAEDGEGRQRLQSVLRALELRCAALRAGLGPAGLRAGCCCAGLAAAGLARCIDAWHARKACARGRGRGRAAAGGGR
jgi:hypothetical protein